MSTRGAALQAVLGPLYAEISHSNSDTDGPHTTDMQHSVAGKTDLSASQIPPMQQCMDSAR